MCAICFQRGRKRGSCSDPQFAAVFQFSYNLYKEIADMAESDTATMVKNAVGFAGGAALIAPVAPPVLHGIAGIAVVGLGIFAAGSLVYKAVETFKGIDNPLKPKSGTGSSL